MSSNDQNGYQEDFASMQIGQDDSDDYEGLDDMLGGFSMDDLNEDDLDYDANNEAVEIDHSVKEKIRMAMAKEELNSDTKDKDLIIMAAAQRIALRRGIPRVPSIFGNPAKCLEFVNNELNGFPPPTHGMLETAKKVFEVGDMAGLAITSMDQCRKYLLAKAKNDSPTAEMLDSAFGIANSTDKIIPPKILSSAKALQEWIDEHE